MFERSLLLKPIALPPRETGFTSRLRRLLEEWDGGAPRTMGPVLEELGVSRRTLQRRLREDGLTYRRLLDQVRFADVLRDLRNPDLKLVEIAYRLGYSDPAHFTRAFLRWTGTSPRNYRRSMALPVA